MKIKLQEYSLINTELIDAEIKITEERLRKNPYNDFNAGKLSVLEDLKEALIPSDKLARVCFENGTWVQNGNIDKEQYFSSEIEIQ